MTMTRVVPNVLLLSVFIYAWIIHDFFFDFYVQSVQEDEYLEWATFFGFLLAMGLFAQAAYDRQKKDGIFPWFLYGLSIFCFLFAMEEISWAQRILGFRPAGYFLEKNFQQELNFHNVMPTPIRELLIRAIIMGYGVLLPMVMLVPWVNSWGQRIGVVTPPVWLTPSFLVTFILILWYPWNFTGELIELVLAFAFAFIALNETWKNGVRFTSQGHTVKGTTPLKQIAMTWVVILALGWSGAWLLQVSQSVDTELVAMAEAEVLAISRDFGNLAREHNDEFPISCRLSKRVYTYIEAFGVQRLRKGQYVALTQQGLPEERAEFFIDPWNAPYWVGLRCDKGEGSEVVNQLHVSVYSLGPNRRRESTEMELRPDDIGQQFTIEY